MGKWQDVGCKAGTRVRVLSGDCGELLGDGVLLADYSREGEMPRIRLDSGGVIRGCECWWIPVAEAEIIEAKPQPPKEEGNE